MKKKIFFGFVILIIIRWYYIDFDNDGNDHQDGFYFLSKDSKHFFNDTNKVFILHFDADEKEYSILIDSTEYRGNYKLYSPKASESGQDEIILNSKIFNSNNNREIFSICNIPYNIDYSTIYIAWPNIRKENYSLYDFNKFNLAHTNMLQEKNITYALINRLNNDTALVNVASEIKKNYDWFYDVIPFIKSSTSIEKK